MTERPATTEPHVLAFDNGMSLELMLDGDEFRGIGKVHFGNTALRSSELPWTLSTESNAGYRFDAFRLANVDSDGTQAKLTLESQGCWGPRAEEGDSMGDSRTCTANTALLDFEGNPKPAALAVGKVFATLNRHPAT
jgi:hypothetical protein